MMRKTDWLRFFDPDEVLNVVDGCARMLSRCFIWRDTDEGSGFWSSQCYFGLTIDGAKALLEMVKYWKENK